MSAKSSPQKCVLMLIADGFSETEAVVILSTLRKAGIYAKSAGLTSGLISGAHGISIMPDFTLADLERSMDPASISMVVLPVGERNLSNLEADPRVYRLLRQVMMQDGFIVTNAYGGSMLKNVARGNESIAYQENERVVLRHSFEQPIEQFAQELVRKL
jgi:putative intracellular protease/amidase